MKLTVSDILYLANPTALAVIDGEGNQLTYSYIRCESERLASAICASGVPPKSTVSVVFGNGIPFITIFFAAMRAGLAISPLNPSYTANEFYSFIKESNSRLVIAPTGLHPCKEAAKLLNIKVIEADIARDNSSILLSIDNKVIKEAKEPEPPEENDIALVLHTSGTTSAPKCVPLRHVNIVNSLKGIVDSYALSEADRSLVVMPLFHVHGLIGATLSSIFAKGSVVLPSRFSASRFWNLYKLTKPTWYSAVPTIHQILLARADSDNAPSKSFRFIRSCSSALAPATLAEMESRFSAPVVEAYGMTEAAHQISTNPLPPKMRVPGTVGAPTGTEICIRDTNDYSKILPKCKTGEVTIKGKSVMWQYLNNQSATDEATVEGWFKTGDQGMVLENGYLKLTGRIKELINRGGEKVSPIEVDEVLLSHPAVIEAVTFAAPDKHYGECVQAVVVLNRDVDVQDVRNFCLERIAEFKVPNVIYKAEFLPKTATGKIQRRLIASHFLSRA